MRLAMSGSIVRLIDSVTGAGVCSVDVDCDCDAATAAAASSCFESCS